MIKRSVVFLAAVSPIVTLMIGPAAVPPAVVWDVIAYHLGFSVEMTWNPATDAIVWLTRVPRIIAGLGIGAILGTAGVILQALTRNPLSEPYVLGVSAGASTGAAVGILFIAAIPLWGINLLAFAGALLATILVLLLSRNAQPLHLILGGLAVGFGFQALTNLAIFSSGSPEASRAVMFWMLGSLSRVQWPTALVALAAGIILSMITVLIGPILDALSSGDETALTVGVDPRLARAGILIPTSAAVAIAVAAAGGIGFVGLIIPHVMRYLVGYSNRRVALASAFAGALFLVWVDAFSRIAFAPSELPVGVISALLGCPCVIALLRRPS